MIQTILSITNITLCAYAFYLNTIPPSQKGSINFWRTMLLLYKTLVIAVAASEVGACIVKVMGGSLPPESQAMLNLCPTSSLENVLYPGGRLSPLAWTGCLIATSGSLFRVWAEKSLGRFMIWDITIRDEHKLCTVGAFSVVRHPSYAGSILALTGHTIFVLGSGTYIHECVGGSYPTAFRVVGGMIAAYVAVGIAGMVKRTAAEDELLKKTFEKEWTEWARKTRYRLFPGIF